MEAVKNEHQPDAKGPRRAKMYGHVQTDERAVPRARGSRLSRLPDARRSWRCAGGKAEWKFSARGTDEGDDGRRPPRQCAGASCAVMQAIDTTGLPDSFFDGIDCSSELKRRE
jgi:hypothetical protein